MLLHIVSSSSILMSRGRGGIPLADLFHFTWPVMPFVVHSGEPPLYFSRESKGDVPCEQYHFCVLSPSSSCPRSRFCCVPLLPGPWPARQRRTSSRSTPLLIGMMPTGGMVSVPTSKGSARCGQPLRRPTLCPMEVT